MTRCVHCGALIRRRISWPSGRPTWFASIGYPLGEWPFCPAVDGNDHEPAPSNVVMLPVGRT